jgi:hypothetical protein
MGRIRHQQVTNVAADQPASRSSEPLNGGPVVLRWTHAVDRRPGLIQFDVLADRAAVLPAAMPEGPMPAPIAISLGDDPVRRSGRLEDSAAFERPCGLGALL